MSEPRDPTDWTDPYADLSGLTGDEPIRPLEDPDTPPATPPGSPLLTGLVVGLLLVALSVAVFQLLTGDDTAVAGATTTTSVPDGTTTTVPGSTTTTTSPLPPSDPYPPVGEAIPVGRMKLMTDRVRVQADDIPDLAFGNAADLVIGALTASFGDPDEDTGWQVSTGEWGVCVGDLERVVRFGPFAAIVTMVDDTDVFNGYRQDVGFGDLGSPASQLETLSGLRAGDTVGDLKQIYANQTVEFGTDAAVGEIFELRGAESNDLILWGPVAGQGDQDPVIGVYAPDLCTR
ncbi:MAG: hypothetical protein IH850_09960 [Acidobacteria bacterium]|nr:hypothetical protein [Acidobacteriota bacterium]